MDHSLYEDSFFHHITSAVVIVDAAGNCRQGSPKGRQRLAQLQLAADSIQDQTPLCLGEVVASSLALTLPACLAASGETVKLSPLGQASGLALMEWLPAAHADAGQEKLKILQEVSQAVNSSLIMEDIFDALGLVLQNHIPYQEAVIVILDDSQNGIKTLVRIFEDGDLEISGEHNAFAGYEPLVHHILRQPVSQLYQKNQLPQSLLLADNAASALVVPLINKGVVIGLIALSASEEHGFNQAQEELLSEVSAQLAVAVENAKFYWQTQAQASREFLINQLTRSIRQSLDTDIILGTAVTELGKVMGISRCFIRYFSPEGQEKAFQYQLPGSPGMAHGLSFSERAVFNLRKDQPYNPFILNDVRDCPPQIASLDYFEASGIKSIAIVPILIRDELVGTITLHQCDAYRAWVMEDIELLKALAEHLGVALHQAQLFLALDQRTKALEQTLEELQQAQLYLVQSEKMAVLGQFVAGIAHEVNTPLGTMISNNATLIVCLDKLRQGALSGTSGETQLFESMDSLLSLNKLAASRIQDIVKNLRNFARLDESELKTVDLRDGIESTILLVQSSLPANIELVRRYGPNVPEVQCYPGLLNQVFMNLIVNASHAIQDKAENSAGETPLNTITIETSYDESSQLVTIAVRDTGKGIPKNNLTKVFDPGFTTKGAGVGTGLGLALCYRIVEKHQGRIYLHSVVNEGTSFFVEIPSHPRK
ncbi:adaptive-response sensory-kinase [Microcystis phage MaAM05]|nr:adaptive-response sensory-kinase [Microcystis phage MaAM05]